jgi:PIN domain nuclease of toxin-antitoxin system
MTSELLLDTCAAIWITENEELSDGAVEAMDLAYREKVAVFVSPITAWERALLSVSGRMASPIQPLAWFERLARDAKLAIAPLTPAILIESWFLPGRIHRDPADRIIVATARVHGLTILTRDREILAYADKGHVAALPC